VIGTASTSAKRKAAQDAGADITIDYMKEDWTTDFLQATGRKKSNVVYDSAGKDTFLKSLDCTAPFGLVALYGAASGPAPAIDPELLNKKGCLYVTRPSLFPHNADPAIFKENTAILFHAVATGIVRATIGAKFRLDKIANVHAAAESRLTNGALIITP
jgi:NADPH2:quinone reductase